MPLIPRIPATPPGPASPRSPSQRFRALAWFAVGRWVAVVYPSETRPAVVHGKGSSLPHCC